MTSPSTANVGFAPPLDYREPVGAAIEVLAVGVAVLLAVFALRRLVLLAASLAPRRRLGDALELPRVTVLVAARDEEPVLPRLLGALDELRYPAALLSVVLVDDGSTDGTGAAFARFAAARPHVVALSLPASVGKAEALNRGLAAGPAGEVVVVCDADLRPEPECLRELVRGLVDPRVAAVAGYMRPENPGSSPVARYAAVETWMHQLVTSAGKDRLGLDPPTLGFGAYRRDALAAVGGFPSVVSGEDVVLTVALVRAGRRTRFAPQARAGNDVVFRFGDYWRQHVRWTRDTFDSGRPRSGRRLHWREVEVWLLAVGYVDRLAFAAALGLGVAGVLPLWLAPAYLGLRAVEVVAAVGKGGELRETPRYLLWTAVFFVVDAVATVAGTAGYVLRRPRVRTSPARPPVSADDASAAPVD